MKTVGIITEYNPFHNGHAWQIQAVREQFGADCAIIAVMSGCFTQRGEPAVMDKWARTRAALACGVNLVLELPFAYATASAERFAAGGVQVLAATGVTKTLVFGSECGDLDLLMRLADVLETEPADFRRALQTHLDAGLSFAAARQQALAAVLANPDEAAILRHANNILAVEYLKAIRRLPAHQRLQPVTIMRRGQHYLDPELRSPLASATAIRRAVSRHRHNLAGLLHELAPAMPAASLAVLMEEIAAQRAPLLTEDLAPSIISLLRTRPPGQLEQISGMQEGLARRLVAAARRPFTGSKESDDLLAGHSRADQPAPGDTATVDLPAGHAADTTVDLMADATMDDSTDVAATPTAHEAAYGAAAGPTGSRSHKTQPSGRLATLVHAASSRRFPQTRVQRALLALLANVSTADLALFDATGGPAYIRVLGFDKQGRYLLRLMRRKASLPIITRGSDFLEHGGSAALQRQAQLDLAATDLWMLHTGGDCGQDFDRPVVIR